MTEPYFEAGKLALESLLLALAFFYAHRARRHAREARASERLAWLHTGDAERHAKRVESLLPPDVIPFPESPPAPAPEAIPEPEAIAFPFAPRLARIPPHGGY